MELDPEGGDCHQDIGGEVQQCTSGPPPDDGLSDVPRLRQRALPEQCPLGEIRRRQQQDVGDMPRIHQAAQGAHSDKYHNSLCYSRPESPHIRIELDPSDGHVP